MKNYCPRCKALHTNNELCPIHKEQLKKNPSLLSEAANFTAIAGQYHLSSSQTLNTVAKSVNKLLGTNLSFEGSHQMVRDIQVFRRLADEAYINKGYYLNAETAKTHILSNPSDLKGKLNGYAQEVDWLRFKQGQLSSLAQKSKLLNGNAEGIDGITINRFTGKTIIQTTVKAAESKGGLGTNINDILKAIKNGTLDHDTTVVGIDGTKDALRKALKKNMEKALASGDTATADKFKHALEQLKVEEINTTDSIKESTSRLMEKAKSGDAHSSITPKQVAGKAVQGAVIGAAVGLTISSITNYLKFKNGELTRDEAFREVAIDTTKGTIIGGGMGTVSCFLPGGPLGFIAGIGIGLYVNKTTQNVLNEIYGKGAFEAILTSSGFVYGSTVNLSIAIKQIEINQKKFDSDLLVARRNNKSTDVLLDEFDTIMRG